jgi:hypothetical protein
MTDWSADFVGKDSQQLPFGHTLGDAMRLLVRSRYGAHAAKKIEALWGLDPKTARNVTQGNCSERTLTKAIRVEGWSLLHALGHALTGQTHHEWEEARLNKIIEEAENAKESIRRLRTRAQLLAEASLDGDATGALESDPEHGHASRGDRKRSG